MLMDVVGICKKLTMKGSWVSSDSGSVPSCNGATDAQLRRRFGVIDELRKGRNQCKRPSSKKTDALKVI
jgi:hypothetical protein